MDSISELYSNIARWVEYYGWIEIGQNGFRSSFVRALDEGGMVWEGKDDYKSLDEALRALDAALGKWMKEEYGNNQVIDFIKENDMKEKGKSLFDDVLNSAKEFVEKHKGTWDHAKWESFLSDIKKKGVSVTEDMSNTVGSVLESIKKLYTSFPKTEAAKEVKKEEEAAPQKAEKKEPEEKKPVTSKPKKAPAAKKPKAPAKETGKITKESYVKKLEDELKQWEAKIDIIQADVDKVKEEHKEQYKKDIDEILSLKKEAKNVLQKLKKTSDDEWEELKDGADKAWGDLETAIEKVLSFEP
jgi:chromosome segregation ATPase